ncbi:hypothetical protein 1 [Wenling crustacean virus 10]|uniref:Nucleoprotein n=1 Tax=Wenling crustacean virus 10 TaxID=1923479 RepID=A0A1L3KNA1_9RHAB|nr:hypothetical protein 1 [Wenling crustacean virus 10]APG78819.1 hypothetical protein 1 [Wenling crustacean virus 10]
MTRKKIQDPCNMADPAYQALSGLPSRLVDVQDKGWSDDSLKKYIKSRYSLPGEDDRITLCKLFLQAYCYGNWQNFKLSEIVHALLLITPTRTEKKYLALFACFKTKQSPLIDLSGAKVQPADDATVSDPKTSQKDDTNDLQGLVGEHDWIDDDDNIVTGLPRNTSSFYKGMLEALDGDDKIAAIRFCCFLAWVCFRTVVKEVSSVRAYLGRAENFSRLVTNLTDFELPEKVPLPSKIMLEKIAITMGKGTASVRELISWAVYVKVHSDNDDDVRMMEGGCLTHLSENGIGLVGLVDKVAGVFSVSIEEILSLILTSHTMNSVIRLADFIKHVVPKVKSWKWSRVIDDQCFSSLKILDNIVLSAYLVALVTEADAGNDMWNMVVFEQHLPNTTKNQALRWAKKYVVASSEHDQKTGAWVSEKHRKIWAYGEDDDESDNEYSGLI